MLLLENPETLKHEDFLSPDWMFCSSPRRVYYSEAVDMGSLADKSFQSLSRTRSKLQAKGSLDDLELEQSYIRKKAELPKSDTPANLVGSLCKDGLHRPVFDWDHPEVDKKFIADFFGMQNICNVQGFPYWELVMAVPSTKYWHIYIPWVAFEWPDYLARLQDLTTFRINGENCLFQDSQYNYFHIGNLGHAPQFHKDYNKFTREYERNPANPIRRSVIQQGYVAAAKTQEGTLVRLPYIKKPVTINQKEVEVEKESKAELKKQKEVLF